MYNPRWPHTFTAYVASKDANGHPLFDENGDPVMTQLVLEKAVYDSRMNPVFGVDGSFERETVYEMPWGYRTATGGISDSGEVFHTDFKISCPMFFTQLEEGMILHLTDYAHTFVGTVKKMTTYNWGTNVWLDRYGNEAAATDA